MKKISFLLAGLILNISVFAQISNILQKPASVLGKQIARQINLLEEKRLQPLLSGNEHLFIYILPFKNDFGETTEISYNLANLLANAIDQNIKPPYPNFKKYSVFTNGSNYDFSLSGTYKLTDTGIALIGLNLTRNDAVIGLGNFNAPLPPDRIEKLKAYDCCKTCPDIPALARSITLQLSNSYKNLKKIKVLNFYESSSGLASEFSEILALELMSALPKYGNIQVFRDENTRSILPDITYKLEGKYYLDNNNLKINAFIIDPKTKAILGSANAQIPEKVLLHSGISYLPANKDLAVKTKDTLENNKIKNDFDLFVWTNKGKDNPVFLEGEKMNIYVQASQSCYIRVIDILSSGEKVLLIDNYFYATPGTPYKLPYDFICSPPFGAETIIVQAQTQPFNPLKIKVSGQYKFIVDNLENIITRSFITKPNILKAQAAIYLITAKK